MPDPDGGPALFRLVRFWSRRWSVPPTADDRRLRHIEVLTAVDAAGPEPTIADLAHQLGIDRSGASRLVRDAAAAGLLDRLTAEPDRRRAAVAPTPAGRELLATALGWQRAAFAELTASWSAADRDRFAGYLRRLADEQGDLMNRYDGIFAAMDRTTVLQDLAAAAMGEQYPAEVEPYSGCSWWLLSQAVAALRLRPGDLLVDLGCGRGGAGLWLARALSARLVGLDGSGVAIAAATRRATAFLPAGRATFRVADHAATGLPDGHAAAVVSVDALPFAADRDAALAEVRRILRPGGLLVFSCAQRRQPEHPWEQRLTTAGFTLRERLVDPHFARHWTRLYEQWLAHADRLHAELGAQVADRLLAEATTELPARDGLLLVAQI